MDLGPTSLSWLNTVPFGHTNEYLQISKSTSIGCTIKKHPHKTFLNVDQHLMYNIDKIHIKKTKKGLLAESPTGLLNAHVVHLAERLLVRVEPFKEY